MPGLDEVYDGGSAGAPTLQLATALGLVLVGAATLAAGASGVLDAALVSAGVPVGIAGRTALATALCLPPLLFAGVLRTLEPTPDHRRLAGGAGGLALAGVVGVIAFGAGPFTVALYALGVAGLFASVGWAAVDSPDAADAVVGEREPATTPRRDPPGRVPADGGTEDDELRFPLDDER
jgi:hypothetical protein